MNKRQGPLSETAELIDALVIGAGPAGLMAASELARAGRRVVITEAKPSVGRKFLMAGKSGLNLTKDEGFEVFLASYMEAAEPLRPMLEAFPPEAVQDWARALGQEVFTGTSKRVFPKAMKASPLLRAWMQDLNVETRTRWRWTGWHADAFRFDTPDGTRLIQPKVTVLALGGGSWARLGSDGAWVEWLAQKGVPVAPFKPANMGFQVAWSNHMAAHLGQPIKSVTLIAGEHRVSGEFVLSSRGIEGGGIYAVSKALREGADLALDLLPQLEVAQIVAKLGGAKAKETLSNRLRKRLGLSGAKLALVMEFGRPLPADDRALAERLKALPIAHQGPRPMDEAISTAGGVTWDALDEHLMLRALPNVFCAGEMLDWEAPTGGYLLSVCFATGAWAGRSAAQFKA